MFFTEDSEISSAAAISEFELPCSSSFSTLISPLLSECDSMAAATGSLRGASPMYPTRRCIATGATTVPPWIASRTASMMDWGR